MKETVSTTDAPGAIGPYSQATVVSDKLIFTSGQIPVDPATGAFPDGIKAQTRQSLANVRAVIEAAGATMENVVKTTVFLRDMNDFAVVNEVYASFFSEAAGFPARSAVQVARLPKDALIEIEAVAVKG